MWYLLADEFGGIHPEGLGQVADSGHAGVGHLAALQAADVVAVGVRLLRQLLATQEDADCPQRL